MNEYSSYKQLRAPNCKIQPSHTAVPPWDAKVPEICSITLIQNALMISIHVCNLCSFQPFVGASLITTMNKFCPLFSSAWPVSSSKSLLCAGIKLRTDEECPFRPVAAKASHAVSDVLRSCVLEYGSNTVSLERRHTIHPADIQRCSRLKFFAEDVSKHSVEVASSCRYEA